MLRSCCKGSNDLKPSQSFTSNNSSLVIPDSLPGNKKVFPASFLRSNQPRNYKIDPRNFFRKPFYRPENLMCNFDKANCPNEFLGTTAPRNNPRRSHRQGCSIALNNVQSMRSTIYYCYTVYHYCCCHDFFFSHCELPPKCLPLKINIRIRIGTLFSSLFTIIVYN